MDFDRDTGLERVDGERWEGEIVDGWWTPRGPLGGYVMALGLRALVEAVDDPERSPRSVTMHFLRPPQLGPVKATAHVERAGRSLTTVSGRLEQGGKTLALALGAFSRPWQSPLLTDATMPAVEPGDEERPPTPSMPGRKPPPFTQKLTMQHRFGGLPFSRAEHAETGGWMGLRQGRPLDSLAVAVLADAWFPAPWPRLRALAAAPTIDLTVHFRVALPIADSLLLGRFRSRLVRDGFFEEDGELWTPDGTLVAQSRQLALLIGAEV